MGTSKAYGGLKGNPNWSTLSRDVTRACSGEYLDASSMQKIMSGLVTTFGGSEDFAYGQSTIGGSAGTIVAQKLCGIISSISTIGWLATQKSISPDFAPQNAEESTETILEHCAGVANQIDEVAAKKALKNLTKEIVGDAETNEDFEAKFKQYLEQFTEEEIIIRYYANYLHEHLSVLFFEKLIRDKGLSATANFYRQIKAFIFVKLKNISRNLDLKKVDWKTSGGKSLCQGIFADVLKAFEYYEG